MTTVTGDGQRRRLDEAARAGWLYYVAGCRQDEIAQALGVSRQTAQRLVALAAREKLVRIRLDHPIMRCMELAQSLRRTFGLISCDVVPSTPGTPFEPTGLAQAGAHLMERVLAPPGARIVAVGTGRTLRACVEDLVPMRRPDHTIVSLLGHTMPGGRSTPYNIAVRMADRIDAGHYPMPLPIYARNRRERDLYRILDTVREVHGLAARADAVFVGIGSIGPDSPLCKDGFLTPDDVAACIAQGAVGEITGWIFDADGALVDTEANQRVNSVPLRPGATARVIGIAAGADRVPAIHGALRGRLVSGLITNEATAEAILAAATARAPEPSDPERKPVTRT
jgi:DNA-binding transcriptional regulator LsrR (DeoR family)